MENRFEDDPKDRKRRFLRGLNCLIGNRYLEDMSIGLGDALQVDAVEFRNRLANVYCLEFSEAEIVRMLDQGMTTGEFTEKYCEVIYRDRGNVDLNVVIGSSMVKTGEGGYAICPSEMDKAPKYGLNGREWCDVATGPCSCAAWHD